MVIKVDFDYIRSLFPNFLPSGLKDYWVKVDQLYGDVDWLVSLTHLAYLTM